MPHDDKLLSLYDDLMPALDELSAKAVPRLLAALAHRFNLGALSLYTVSERGHSAILRAQHGLELSEYKNLERTTSTSAVVRVIRTGEMLLIRDITAGGFEEPVHAVARGWNAAVVIPLPEHRVPDEGGAESESANHAPRGSAPGAICAYPIKSDELTTRSYELESAMPIVAACYWAALRNDRLALREALLEKALGSRDLNSSLHRAIAAAKTYIPFEGASVFLWDRSRALLRLHASTGLSDGLRKEDITYAADDASRTVEVGRTGTPYSTVAGDGSRSRRRHTEATAHPEQSFIALPILDWRTPNPKQQPPAGVFRAVNRVVADDSNARVVSFSWEDAEGLRVVADTIGFVAAVFGKADTRVLEFERVMHGVRSNVEASLQNLNLLTEREGLITVNEPRVEYAIPDTISHLEVLKAQIERLESWEQRLVVGDGRVRLFADVLVKARNYVRRISRSFDVKQVKLTDLEEAGFSSIPFVKGDAEALGIVFRNLFENALKYSDARAAACEIALSFEVETDAVRVLVADNGMGIDESDIKGLFVEGFRGERAIRKRVLGSGIGLAQSRGLMRRMRGDLTLERRRPATFAVRVPRWKDSE